MNLTSLNCLRAIPLAAAALLPDLASAGQNVSCGDGYYDPCDAFSGWVDLAVVSSGKIPIDGVLVLQGAIQNAAPGPEEVALTVTTDGMPLAGKVEATDLPGTLIWRPDGPWVAGATYQITGTATNPDADGDCLSLELPLAGEVTIDAAPAPELTPVNVEGTETEHFAPTVDLATLVCCEGAMPTANPGDCNSDGAINYDPGECTPTQGQGYFDLALTATPLPSGPVAQQLAFRLKSVDSPGQDSLSPMFNLPFLTFPICVSIDLVDLASSEVVAGPEKCFGEDLAAKLGPQSIDPAEVLDCKLQNCEPNSNSDGWDPDKCEPYDPGDPPTTGLDDTGATDATGGDDAGENDGEKACACNSSPSPGAGLVLVLAGLGLSRRRRVPR